MDDLEVLYDLADQEYERDQRERIHEVMWALAWAARVGTPKEAMAILEREIGVRA